MKKKLIEARELAFKNADAIVQLVETEDRAMTEEEMTSLRGFHEEMESLDSQILLAEEQEKLRAGTAKVVTETEAIAVHGTERAQATAERKIIKEFNILKALRHLADPTGVPLTGAELEMDQEARKEQHAVGISHLVSKGINLPAFAVRANEQIATVNEQGGFTVDTSLVEVIGILRPRLAVRAAGARVLTGLTGNLNFTTQDGGATTNWNTEIETSTQTGQTYTQATMSPNRLAAWTPVSLQLLAQSSIDMQQFVIDDLNDAMNAAIENAVFNGTGVAPIPQGLLGEVPELGIGVNGGTISYDHAVDMESALQVAETVMGSMAYIMNSKTYGQAKKERTDAGSGIFTIPQGSNTMNGYPVYVSNHLPSDLDKGSESGTCSALLLGNWRDLLIGNWGGANIIVDPYTNAKEGMINIVTNTFWDILARRLASFVSTSDVVTG